MTLSLSLAASSLWAKSTDDGRGHALIGHLLDVAACAEAVLEREPATTRALYAQDLQTDEANAMRWIVALVGLHDLGKAAPSFQHKWQPGAQRVKEHGLAWSITPPNVPHGVISYDLLRQLLGRKGWFRKTAGHLGDAIGAHHGFRAVGSDLRAAKSVYVKGTSAWTTVQQEIVDAVLATVGVHTPQESVSSLEELSGAAFMRLAGLTSFVDWIGSNADFFPYGRDVGDLAAYYRHSLELAHRALDTIGWIPRQPLSNQPVTFQGIFTGYEPRPLQQTMIELVNDQHEPCLLIVEAPMGEGKTEAALYAYSRLQKQVGHRGMYVALPTQATGNAMFERVQHFLSSDCFEHHAPVDLQLLHGASLLSNSYADLRIRAVDGDEHAVVAREWFSAKKRALLTEYGVGTVDQALLSILNIKHQFVRLWGLANRVVVIDEVHAYDMYTGKLIETLVQWLHALGSSVILMSATLPNDKRHDLLAAFGVQEEVSAPYPRITKVDSTGATTRTFAARPQAEILVDAADFDLEHIADLTLEQIKQGGCAACVVNTVNRAQELYQRLQTMTGEQGEEVELYLFHARYPAEDRKVLENRVLSLFGKEAHSRPHRAVLVATQVVEQSLDVDFDVMVTDIAPIDLVLQRAGRMHRHDRPERPIKTPRLYVAGLTEDIPDFGVHGIIYDPYTLLKTWATLTRYQTIQLPDDFDPLINAVYSDDVSEGATETLEQALEQAKVALLKDEKKRLNAADEAIVGKPDGFMGSRRKQNETQDDIDEDDARVHAALRPVTRLGDPTITVIPLFQHGDLLTLDRAGNIAVNLDEALSYPRAKDIYAKDIYMRSVKLSNRYNRYRALLDVGVPKGWQTQPLLRHCYPLIVDENGKVAFDAMSITVSDELGIVVEYNKQ